MPAISSARQPRDAFRPNILATWIISSASQRSRPGESAVESAKGGGITQKARRATPIDGRPSARAIPKIASASPGLPIRLSPPPTESTAMPSPTATRRYPSPRGRDRVCSRAAAARPSARKSAEGRAQGSSAQCLAISTQERERAMPSAPQSTSSRGVHDDPRIPFMQDRADQAAGGNERVQRLEGAPARCSRTRPCCLPFSVRNFEAIETQPSGSADLETVARFDPKRGVTPAARTQRIIPDPHRIRGSR